MKSSALKSTAKPRKKPQKAASRRRAATGAGREPQKAKSAAERRNASEGAPKTATSATRKGTKRPTKRPTRFANTTTQRANGVKKRAAHAKQRAKKVTSPRRASSKAQSANKRTASSSAVRTELDEQHFVASALEARGFRVRQNVSVKGLFADIYAERADATIVIEMKRRSKFTTTELREAALRQAKGYARALKPRFVGISDGQRLMLIHKKRLCTHQLVEGAILQSTRSAPCPLDLGADYLAFRDFPKKQRNEYRISDTTIIPRTWPFDLKGFLDDKSLDVLLVAGEPGAGKTTFAWQMANAGPWDPLWLNASLLKSDPIETLTEAKTRLTGFTGDVAAFLRTLQAYRQRPRQKPTGIIVDAADEWQRVHHALPALLRFAKSVKMKVAVLGRPQTIDLLIDDAHTLDGFSLVRHDLHTFNNAEWERAAEKYIRDYNLQSPFEGHAKTMSVVPEMMALIASAYQDGAIDPDLTEPRLYEAYRRKKAARVASKTDQTSETVQQEIYSVADAMLETDRVSLSHRQCREASFLTANLIKEGVLRTDGQGRSSSVRFRFGRVRDDLLRDVPANELFAKPIVGRSALTYVALRDNSVRREYIRLSLAESNLEAVCIVREQGWWRDLASMPPSAISQPYIILGYARQKLKEYPQLLALAGADPNGLRLASVHNVEETPLPLWRTWLAAALEEQQLHDVTDLTLTLFRAGKLPTSDVLEAVAIIRARLFRDRRSAKEGHRFWPLVGELSARLTPRDARTLLRRVVPAYAIAHSSVSMMHHFYPGLDYSGDMMAVVANLRERTSARSFEAWASSLLLSAHIAEWPPFNGKEPSGSDRDNAWLIDAIVPAMAALLKDKPQVASRLLSRYRISRFHPAFRLRGYIYAAPISTFDKLTRKMMSWRRMRSTGIPALSDALDSRSTESPALAEAGLNDALKRFSQPINQAQTIAFHRRLARGDAHAMRQATAFVSLPDFKYRDMFRTDFFVHLNWAARRPVAAARLVAAALKDGYDDMDLVRSRGHGTVFALAFTNPRVRKVLDDIPGVADILAQYVHEAPEDAQREHAVRLYNSSHERGKRSILRWAHKMPIEVAAQIARRGLQDDALIPEPCSSDDDVKDAPGSGTLHDDAWFALVMCWQEWKDAFFHALGVDVLELAKRYTAPLGIAATVMPVYRYALEYQEDKATTHRCMKHLLSLGAMAGPHLRDFVAQSLANFFGMMTGLERAEFWRLFGDTETAAKGALGLARERPDDGNAVDRALRLARESRHRSSMAWVIYQSAGGDDHDLSAVERDVVSALLDNPDQETLHKLSYAAAELSNNDSAAATNLLLQVARRAADTGSILHGSHLMRYDWSKTRVSDLEATVTSVARSHTTSYAIVEVVVSGLSSKTDPTDAGRISVAFESLVTEHEWVREAYLRWRSEMTK